MKRLSESSTVKKKIAIICSYPIPEGMASTTRIMTYARGLKLQRVDVKVLSYISSGNLYRKDYLDNGVFNGVEYYYPNKRKSFNNKILHQIDSLYGILRTVFHLIKEKRKHGYDAFIISNDQPVILFLFSICAKLIRVKCIFIFDEFPRPIRGELKNRIPFLKSKAYTVVLPLVDGYISMTERLADYYNNFSEKPSLILSSVTDLDRYQNLKAHKIEGEFTVTYLGNMELSKDNVDNIIRAFSKLYQKLESARLYLYGNPQKKDKVKLMNVINELNLNDVVSFGFVPFSEVPYIISSSHLLVSSQPDTLRAAGGFPTKLGEYMASGVPVLITRVGEIPNFVHHEKEVFFAEPEDVEDFAEKLLFIADNYTFALEVGERAKRLVEEKYSHRSAGKKIKEFIENI